MALADTLTVVEYHTQFDPYTYVVDNRPLGNLAARDVQLANAIESRTIQIDITGSGTPTLHKVPTGWTCSSSGAGVYTIAHDMATTNFVVVGMIQDAAPGMIHCVSKSSTELNINTTDATGTPAHRRFNLIISRY